jgi:hypothetical protein
MKWRRAMTTAPEPPAGRLQFRCGFTVATDPNAPVPESWLHRYETEQNLVDLCERYEKLVRTAFIERGGDEREVIAAVRWAVGIGLVSAEEEEAWLSAMGLRNAILLKKYRIVLEDIAKHAAVLSPIVDALPDRLEALPAPESNVRYLR